jgi:hypothetical protein
MPTEPLVLGELWVKMKIVDSTRIDPCDFGFKILGIDPVLFWVKYETPG